MRSDQTCSTRSTADCTCTAARRRTGGSALWSKVLVREVGETNGGLVVFDSRKHVDVLGVARRCSSRGR